METILNGSLAHSIGWALIHFIWQGAVAGGFTALMLTALRRSSANLRYVVACFGLLLMFALPIATAIDNARTIARPPVTGERTTAAVGAGPVALGSVENSKSTAPVRRPDWQNWMSLQDLEAWLPTAVLFWFAGVTALSLRILTGWFIVQRMRRYGSTPAAEICESVRTLASRLRVTRPVQVVESALVSVPTVIGSLRPIILWPAGALTGLSPEQVEAVIAHELAHIRRLDYFVNMWQTMVETLLFYHPAVWMISSRIRIEREHCCDDLAVALCRDRLVYASALAGLEELRSDGAALALRATGGSLIGRVRRLLGAPLGHDRRDPAWMAIGAIALMLAFAIFGTDLNSASMLQIAPALAPTPAAPASAPKPQAAIAAPAPILPAGPSALPVLPALQARSSLGEGRMRWSNPLQEFDVRYQGVFTLADDDRDLKEVSLDGYLTISEKQLLGADRTIELRGRTGGLLERRYRVGNREESFEPDGRAWLAEVLPMIVRRTGFAADARVARILKQVGPGGVLAEISQIESDYARRVYFKTFLEQARPTGSMLAQALDQAGREIGSDYELAELLIAAGSGVPLTRAEANAYFGAMDSVGSDYERRRALTAVAKRVSDPAIVANMLESASRIGSDYELAEFLISLARPQLSDAVRDSFFRALDSVQSDYENRRVLSSVVESNLSAETLTTLLRSTDSIASDFERATLLVHIAQRHKLEGALRNTYLEAADRISSAYEKNRVLADLMSSERRE